MWVVGIEGLHLYVQRFAKEIVHARKRPNFGLTLTDNGESAVLELVVNGLKLSAHGLQTAVLADIN